MAQPTPYTPATDFSAEESASTAGRSTVRTTALDAEFAALQLTITQALSNLSILQRDDTRLADQAVRTSTLHPEVITLIGSATFNPRGLWVTATAYAKNDLVEQSGSSYLCVTAHTSGTFSTDYAAEKWMVLTPVGTSAVSNYVKPSGGTPTTAPSSAGTDSMAIGSGSVVTGTRPIAIGVANATGTDSLAINITNSTTTYGAQAANAVAIGKLASVATGCTGGVAIGGDTNAVTQGTNGAIVGGSGNLQLSTSGFVGGGLNNSAGTGQQSAIVGGLGNTVSSGCDYCAIVGGQSHFISSGSWTHSGMLGGLNNVVAANYAAALGGAYTKARLTGQVTWGAATNVGDGQASHVVAQKSTTDATPTSIYTMTSTGTRLLVQNNSTVLFSALIVGRRTDVAGEAAAYRIEGLISNNAGTTALIGSISKTVIAESDATWDATIVADNTNDAIDVQVTGAAGKTIKWAANLTLVEVGLS